MFARWLSELELAKLQEHGVGEHALQAMDRETLGSLAGSAAYDLDYS